MKFKDRKSLDLILDKHIHATSQAAEHLAECSQREKKLTEHLDNIRQSFLSDTTEFNLVAQKDIADMAYSTQRNLILKAEKALHESKELRIKARNAYIDAKTKENAIRDILTRKINKHRIERTSNEQRSEDDLSGLSHYFKQK